MIGSLRGALLDRWGDGDLLIEVGGIGYRVTVTPTTLVELGSPGDDVFVHVHHHLRDDTQVLYGFRTRTERECFESLLAAHGVGPALALAILSVHGPDALRQVVADDDIDALCLVPGVGKKTAARLLIELKSSLSQPVLDAARWTHRRRRVERTVGARRRARGAGQPGLRARRGRVGACASCPRPTTCRCCSKRRSSAWRWADRARRAARSRRRARTRRPRSAWSNAWPPRAWATKGGLRPRRLDDFVGQAELKEHLAIILEAARRRGQAVDHLLFAGPPGLGKTTLAGHRRRRDGRRACTSPRARRSSGPATSPPSSPSSTEGDVLFIDEIHRLSRTVEEVLYPAMEDFQLDIVLGKGPRPGRSVSTCLASPWSAPPPAPGSSPGPLRDRFGLVARLDYYDAGRSRADRRARRRHPRGDPRPAAPTRSRRRARGTPAHRQPPAAPRPRLRRGPRHRRHRPGHRPRRAGALRRRRPRARQGRPRHPRRPSASASAAARSGCRRWPSASASRPRRSRTSTSRSSSSRACSCARPAGGSPRPPRGRTSACSRRRAPPWPRPTQPPSLFEG